MKKIITLLLSFLMLLSVILPSGIFAEISRKQFIITEEGYNEIDSFDVSDKHSGANVEGVNISFQTGEWTEYDIVIPKDGDYNIYIGYGTLSKFTAKILVDGEEVLVTDLPSTGGYSPAQKGFVGKIALTEGVKTFRVLNGGGSLYFRYFGIEFAPKKQFAVSTEEMTEIDAYDVTDRHDAANQEGESVSFQGGEWTTYNLAISESGYYNFYIEYGFPGTGLFVAQISVDGELALEKDFSATGGYSTFVLGNAGRVYLEEGVHPVTVKNGGGSLYFRHFCVEYLRDIEVSDIIANDETSVLASDSTVSRGVDSFNIIFNQNVKADTVTNETVKLFFGENVIPAEVSCDGKIVTLNIKETLDFSKNYKLVINGVYDKHGYTQIENEEYVFSTNDSSETAGSAYFEVGETTFNERSMKIEGTMLSSAGVPISGRKIEVYAITPSGIRSEKPECTSVSDENGKVVLEGELKEGCESGLYTLDLKYEYQSASLTLEMVYVSASKEQELADTLKDANSIPEIENFFETNAVMFGFDLEEDIKNLDESLIYGYFKDNKPESFNEIREDYYKYLNMERINQASSEDQISDILSDEDACAVLGITKAKIELVVDYKQMMIEEIFNFSPIRDEDEFDEMLSAVTEKYYAKEYNISSPDAKTDADNVDKGQTIFVELAFDKKVDNITGATFVVEIDDAELLEDCIVKANAPFSAIVNVKGNIAEVIFEADEKVDGVLKMGELGIVNTEKEGKWDVTVGGAVSIDVEADYDAIVPINEDSIFVSVNVNNKKPGGGSSSSPSGNGRGNGGVITQNPEAKPEQPEIPENKYEFIDIDGVEWAKDSIYSLLESGVISESADNKFNPNNNVTRAEFVKLLVVGLELEGENAKSTLNDVNSSSWYYPYVAVAEEAGLVTGDEKGNFNPESSITRQDMSAMIYRICKKMGYNFDEEEYGEVFADDDMISDYAKEAVYSMRLMKIINGVGDNQFAPKNFATRAQAAKIICETVKVVND